MRDVGRGRDGDVGRGRQRLSKPQRGIVWTRGGSGRGEMFGGGVGKTIRARERRVRGEDGKARAGGAQGERDSGAID